MVDISSDIVSFDSNIWIYRFMIDPDVEEADDLRKRKIATTLTSEKNIVLTTQIVNEVCAVLLRKANFTETQLQQLIAEFYAGCNVLSVDREAILQASILRSHHNFSYWDSLIVASCLRGEVSKLYSEDMQDGLVVADKLEIINPFR